MPVATTVSCPHCSAENAYGAQFCESCGMALPSSVRSGPRVLDGASFATTGAGQRLQSEELHKQAKKAAGALLAVAIIQTVVTAALLALANANPRAAPLLHSPVLLGIAAIATVFWCLYIWARFQPLPAAIVGLVLYATLVVINVVTAVGQMSANGGQPHNGGFGGIGIGWIDIVILAVLGQAISAGMKYRKMMQGGIA